MALSAVRTIFGIHSVTPYNRTNGVPYGTAKLVAGSTFSISGSTVDLFGGSSRYAWAIEDGTIDAELGMVFREYPDFGFEVFLGKSLTEATGETTGNVSTLTNKNGTSAVDATTGMASIAATGADEADLKFGKYTIIVLAGGVTCDVYCSTDVDFARGTDATFEDDTLTVVSAVAIADTGATVAIPAFGLTITSGSGTIAMTVGHTCTFDVRPINTSNTTAVFGGTTDTYPTFGCLIYAQASGEDKLFEIDVYKCKALGMPINFNAGEFSEAEVSAKAFYDSTRSGVFSMRHIVV